MCVWAGDYSSAERLSKALAELTVDVEGLGQVVLGRQRSHEVAIAALPQRGEADELLTGPNGACHLGPCDAQLGSRVALQGPEAEDGQLVADLVDPRGVVAGQEVAFGDE